MKSRLDHIRIVGLGAAVPKVREEIADTTYATEAGRRKFMAMTGIQSRRRAQPNQCTSDLAYAAAERILDELGWERASVDLLVLVTQSADYALPATAIVLQDRLQLGKGCAAFDINLGCSGYTYGIATVGGMMRGMGARRALVLVGDTSSRGVPPSEAESRPPLFGDAGTATALEYDEQAPPMFIDLQSDGSGKDAIIQRRGASREPHTEETFRHGIDEFGCVVIDNDFALDGIEVFNFSVREVPPAVRGLLDYAETDIDAVDGFVFHQANKMINDVLRKKLKLPVEKVPSTLAEYGNTSSATVPLTMVSELGARLRDGPMNLLLCGFGVGLSWGTVLCRTEGIVCPEVIEL